MKKITMNTKNTRKQTQEKSVKTRCTPTYSNHKDKVIHLKHSTTTKVKVARSKFIPDPRGNGGLER